MGWSGVCLHFSLGQWLQPSSIQLWFLGHSYNESPTEELFFSLLHPSCITLCGSERLPQLVMLPSLEHPPWLNSNLLCLRAEAKNKTFLCNNIQSDAQMSSWFVLVNGNMGFFLLGSFPAAEAHGPGVKKGHASQPSCGGSSCCLVWQKPQDFQSNSLQVQLINMCKSEEISKCSQHHFSDLSNHPGRETRLGGKRTHVVVLLEDAWLLRVGGRPPWLLLASCRADEVLLPLPAMENILSLKWQRLVFLEVKYQISVPGSAREL